MSKKKKSETYQSPALVVKDCGQTRYNVPLRDIFLIDGHGGTGQETIMQKLQVVWTQADKLAELFERLGVPIVREDRAFGTEEVTATGNLFDQDAKVSS